jgi:hypothetical protein
MPRSSRPVGAATPLVEATAGTASALLFGAASALRRARIFHPDGVAFHGRCATTGGLGSGVRLFDRAEDHAAVVRFSRGVGLPESMPDILGLAVRIVDAHGPGHDQDLLLVTSGGAPGARHALVPTRTFAHQRWSSLLPFSLPDGRRVVIGARPVDVDPRVTTLEALRKAAAGGDLQFALEVAEPRGPWIEVAQVEVGAELDDAAAERLRFDPSTSGGGLGPVGFLQAIRHRAYAGSQRGRDATT